MSAKSKRPPTKPNATSPIPATPHRGPNPDPHAIHRQMPKHDDLWRLFEWIQANKDEIQKQLWHGKAVEQYANEQHVSVATMKRSFRNAGIELMRANRKVGPTYLQDILTVIQRLCIHSGVRYDELQKHINPPPDNSDQPPNFIS